MEELMEKRHDGSDVITYTDYTVYKQDLRSDLQRAAESFVRIGYMLKVARDTRILEGSGYESVNEFALKEFELEKTQVSRFININDRFAKDGYSLELREEYKDYGYAKLAMMLTLPEEVNEMLSPEMSKAEIKAIKDEVDEEKKKTDIEVMLEEKDEVQQSLDDTLAKALYQWGKDTPENYAQIWDEAQRCRTGEITAEALVNTLAPGGFILIMTRIPGEGRCSVKIDENSEQVSVMLIRDGQRHTYSKTDAAQVLMDMCGGSDAKKQWSELYNLAYPEPVKKEPVAPVQPKKESHVQLPPKPKKERLAEKPEEKIEEKPQGQPEAPQGQSVEQNRENEVQEQSTESEKQSQPAESIGEDEQRERSAQSTGENEPQEQQSEEDTAKANQTSHVEGRRSAKVAELEAKKHYWAESLSAHEVALRNRISMQHWEKVAEMAAQIKDEAEKIVDLQNEIKEIQDAIQMRIEDMEDQQDAAEDE